MLRVVSGVDQLWCENDHNVEIRSAHAQIQNPDLGTKSIIWRLSPARIKILIRAYTEQSFYEHRVTAAMHS